MRWPFPRNYAKRIRMKTLHAQGFRMPAEWAPHQGTIMCWPCDEELWVGALSVARADCVRLIKTIAKFEPVHLIVNSEIEEREARGYLGDSNIRYYQIPIDDIWSRDTAPIFVTRGEEVLPVKWEFNSWGQKFQWLKDTVAAYPLLEQLGASPIKTGMVLEGGSIDVNGKGIALTTRQCLLSPKRNPKLSQQDLERYLHDYLGIEQTIWLNEGLEGDHTDGHIDTIVRFVNADTILCSVCEDRNDANYEVMQQNLAHLRAAKKADGSLFHVEPLPLPRKRRDFADERLPLSYANFYIGNGFVVVPTFEDENDERGVEIVGRYFAGREIIPLSSSGLVCGGGSFHCVTQQIPAGRFVKGELP